MCALVFLSIYWLRRHWYETFLVIHIVLSVLILATMLGYVLCSPLPHYRC